MEFLALQWRGDFGPLPKPSTVDRVEPVTGVSARAAGQDPSVPDAASGPSALFGDDGFTFWDLLDIVNPLQHIPVVSTLYRSITGDQIDPGSQVLGGALFGGVAGAVASVANLALKNATGSDLGEHALAAVAQFGPPVAPTDSTAGVILAAQAAAQIARAPDVSTPAPDLDWFHQPATNRPDRQYGARSAPSQPSS